MPATTIGFSLVLIALGLFGYFGSTVEHVSPTALIPAMVGVLLAVCGLVAMFATRWRKHAMHVAVIVGTLGALAALGRGATKIGDLLSQDPDVNRRPILMMLAMGVVCLLFVACCIYSFLQARIGRQD